MRKLKYIIALCIVVACNMAFADKLIQSAGEASSQNLSEKRQLLKSSAFENPPDIAVLSPHIIDSRVFGSFSAAKSDPSTEHKTILVSRAERVNDCTVPLNRSVEVIDGGTLIVNANKLLTINGRFQTGLHKALDTSAINSRVLFGQGALSEVYPQWFGAIGDGTSDDTPALQNSIESLANVGGTIVLPAGHYKTTNTIKIGNGSSSGSSMNKPVVLRGVGGGGSPGDYLRGPSVFIEAYFAGPAVLIQGPINSWGLENICINANTTSRSAIGLKVVSAQYGHARNVSILNFHGIGLLETTVGTLSLNYHNVFDSTWVSMPADANAIGISITGTGDYGSGFEEYRNTYVVVSHVNSTGIKLAFCDNIKFYNTEIVNAVNGTGILFDYAKDASFQYRTCLPSECVFFGLEVYGNTIVNHAPDGYGSPPGRSTNKVYQFSRTNGARAPRLFNLSIVDEPGVLYASIYRKEAFNIAPGSHKIQFDTKSEDPDNIANTSTTNRIVPTKAGAYVVAAGVGSAADVASSTLVLTITKNGTEQIASQRVSNGNFSPNANVTGIVYMNGNSDFIEAFTYQTGNSVVGLIGKQETYLSLTGPFGGY